MAELIPHRCNGTNREGGPCGRPPIPGGTVCRFHGGSAPQTKQAAQRRLLAAADFAIDYLLALLTPRPPCEACGRSDADRDPVVVRACQLVLDRSGFHPSLTVSHEDRREPSAYTRWLTTAQLKQVAVWLDDAKRRMAAGEPPPLLGHDDDAICVEAEVVESGPEAEASPTGLETSETGRDE
jgi:hypothetical protein